MLQKKIKPKFEMWAPSYVGYMELNLAKASMSFVALSWIFHKLLNNATTFP